MAKTMTFFAAAAVSASLVAGGAQAGCLGGAVIGGVGGHVAGHHALLGAGAGCLVGHHMAVEKKKRDRAAREAAHSQQVQGRRG